MNKGFLLALGLCLFLQVQLGASKVITIPLQSSSRLNMLTRGSNRTEVYGDSGQLKRAYITSPLSGCASNDFGVTVALGVPPQKFDMILDTGSTTLAVASSACGNCGNGAEYTPGSSAAKTSGTISTTYGDQSGWTADIYTDTVAIGPVAVSLTFGAIKTSNQFFSPQGCQTGTPSESRGIIGMGYPPLLESPSQSYIDTVIDSGLLDKGQFAIQMCDTTGNLWLGGYDPKYIRGGFSYTPIVLETYYVVTLSDLRFDGASLGYTANAFGEPIVDSGTSLFILPTNIYNTLVASITSNSNFLQFFPSDFFSSGNCYTLPSHSPDSINQALPTMDIILGTGGQAIELTMTAVSSYILKAVDGGTTYYCPGIAPTTDTLTIMGWSVMNQYTVLFDRDNSQVGFAVTRCGGTPNNGNSIHSNTSVLMLIGAFLALFFAY